MYPVGLPANDAIKAAREIIIAGDAEIWIAFCWIGIISCSLAVLSVYCFPKERTFPRVFGGWFCAIDGLHFFVELLKFSPIGWLQEKLFWNLNQNTCEFLFVWNAWVESATFVCAVGFSAVVYLAVVKRKDVAEKKYILTFGICFLVYTTLFSMMEGLLLRRQGFARGKFGCNPLESDVHWINMVQIILAFVVECLFIGLSIKYVLELFKAVAKSDGRNKTLYLWIRFIILVMLQTIPRILLNVYRYIATTDIAASPDYEDTRDKFKVLPYGMLVCFWLNAWVVIATNKSLRSMVKQKLGVITSMTASTTITASNASASAAVSAKGDVEMADVRH